MTVLLHKFLRPEQKFDSLEQLQSQIQKDAAEAERLLK
jgi:FAD synthase